MKLSLTPFEQDSPLKSLRVACDLLIRDGVLHFDFAVLGDVSLVNWDDNPTQGQFNLELWKKTCFEIFLKIPGQAEYWEWNFAPNLNWGFFHFEDYRKALPLPSRSGGLKNLEFIRSRHEQVHLKGCLSPNFSSYLSWAFLNRASLELGVSAVLMGPQGDKTYWALKHSSPKPDFHLADNYLHLG